MPLPTECNECEFSLGNDTVRAQGIWQTYWNQSMEARSVQTQDAVLQNITGVINKTMGSLGLSNDQLGFLDNTLRDLRQTEPIFNSTVVGLLDRVNFYSHDQNFKTYTNG